MYAEFASKVHPALMYLMVVNFQAQPNSSHNIDQILFNNLHLFEYDPMNKNLC